LSCFFPFEVRKINVNPYRRCVWSMGPFFYPLKRCFSLIVV
jgi:hypothetical protein